MRTLHLEVGRKRPNDPQQECVQHQDHSQRSESDPSECSTRRESTRIATAAPPTRHATAAGTATRSNHQVVNELTGGEVKAQAIQRAATPNSAIGSHHATSRSSRLVVGTSESVGDTCGYVNLMSKTSAPGPSRSANAWRRPLAAMPRASAVPVIVRPLPADHAASVAWSRSPSSLPGETIAAAARGWTM
jgi:hypothetical protein